MAYLAVAVFALNCICFCCVRCLWRARVLLVARCRLPAVATATCHLPLCCFAACLIGFTSGRVNWFVKQFLIETQRCLWGQQQQYVKVLCMQAKWLAIRWLAGWLVGNAATWQELKLAKWKARWHFYWQRGRQRGRMLHASACATRRWRVLNGSQQAFVLNYKPNNQ